MPKAWFTDVFSVYLKDYWMPKVNSGAAGLPVLMITHPPVLTSQFAIGAVQGIQVMQALQNAQVKFPQTFHTYIRCMSHLQRT